MSPSNNSMAHPLMTAENAPYRAISFDQLMQVDAMVTSEKWTMRDVVRNIVIPNQKPGLSYSLARNEGGLKLDAFVTHCWDEPFKEFCRSLKKVFLHNYRKPNLWICAFAIRQGNTSEINEALAGDLDESLFVKALQEANTFVVVRNSKKDLYSRAWCVLELMYAAQQENLNHIYITGPDAFANEAVNCRQAEASRRYDTNRIMEKLGENNFDVIDGIVRNFQRFPSFSEPQIISSSTCLDGIRKCNFGNIILQVRDLPCFDLLDSAEIHMGDVGYVHDDDDEEEEDDDDDDESGSLLKAVSPVAVMVRGDICMAKAVASHDKDRYSARQARLRCWAIIISTMGPLLVLLISLGGHIEFISRTSPAVKTEIAGDQDIIWSEKNDTNVSVPALMTVSVDTTARVARPCSAPASPIKYWTNELFAIKALETELGEPLQVYDSKCGGLPYPSAHMTLTNSQNKRYAGQERCVVELSISGKGLSTLPEDSLGRMQCLVFLDLSHNNLTEVPDIFTFIPTLTYVDLRGNPLQKLPPSLSQHVQQGTLLVDFLPFILADLAERIHPDDLPAVQQIQESIGDQLEIAFEGRSTIASKRPETNGYPSWQFSELNIDNSRNLVVIRNSEKRHVRSIYLQGQGLSNLPESVYQLKGLAYLSLRNNAFRSFPNLFEGLPELTILDVRENPRLDHLPTSLQKHIQSGGFRVTLSDPILIPTDQLLVQGDAVAIKELESMIGRRIPIMAEATGDLGITIDKSRVRDLSLQNQSLTFLPPSLGNLTHLVTLDLSNNHLTEVPDLFWPFPFLHDVTIEGNSLDFTNVPGSLKNNKFINVKT